MRMSSLLFATGRFATGLEASSTLESAGALLLAGESGRSAVFADLDTGNDGIAFFDVIAQHGDEVAVADAQPHALGLGFPVRSQQVYGLEAQRAAAAFALPLESAAALALVLHGSVRRPE